jgi:hypothetical protein
MKEDNINELKELYRRAAEIAAEVPESMQEAAFNKAVEHLTGYATVHPSPTGGGPTQVPLQPIASQAAAAQLDVNQEDWQSQFNSVGHPEVSEASTVLDKSLHILSIAWRDHGIDQLSPADIATILSEKYRIPAQAGQISDKLGKVAGRLVERRKVGKGFEYKIMLPGEQHLSGQSPLKTTRKKSSTRKSTIKATSGTSKPKSRNGKPGQKEYLVQLLDAGYFDEPRTISDVIAYAAKTKAYSYKTTDFAMPLLRLMRDGKLTRDRDDDGQWEYSKV